MKPAFKRWIFIALSVCVVLLVFGAVVVVHYQDDYRINEINFIIGDNQQENVADLSQGQFTDYLLACGARIDSSGPQWTVHYDGLFAHRTWTFPFVSPSATRQVFENWPDRDSH